MTSRTLGRRGQIKCIKAHINKFRINGSLCELDTYHIVEFIKMEDIKNEF